MIEVEGTTRVLCIMHCMHTSCMFNDSMGGLLVLAQRVPIFTTQHNTIISS